MACNETNLPVSSAGGGAAELKVEHFDYAKRAQWLRAAALGANDGLVSTASMMVGVGAVKTDAKTMVLTGLAGLVAGACSMAIGEFVSVQTQVDVELGQIKRERARRSCHSGGASVDEKRDLPIPAQAAAASALAFSAGAGVPLLAAGFIGNYRCRLAVLSGAATAALVAFGVTGARLGGASVRRSTARVVVGGWLAMAVSFGIMKAVGGFVGL